MKSSVSELLVILAKLTVNMENLNCECLEHSQFCFGVSSLIKGFCVCVWKLIWDKDHQTKLSVGIPQNLRKEI